MATASLPRVTASVVVAKSALEKIFENPRLFLAAALEKSEVKSLAPAAACSTAMEQALKYALHMFPALCEQLLREDSAVWRGPIRYRPGETPLLEV